MGKPVKVTGHKKFHLRGHNSQNPVLNLAGGKDVEGGAKNIEFDNDPRSKKLAWMRTYVDVAAKLAAETADANEPWLRQALDNNIAQQVIAAETKRLTKMLKRPPDEAELSQAVRGVMADKEQVADYTNNAMGNRDQLRLDAATNRRSVDPQEMEAANEAQFDRATDKYNQLPPNQQAKFDAPKLKFQGGELAEDGSPTSNPDLLNSTVQQAEADKSNFISNGGKPVEDMGYGTSGFADLAGAGLGGWGSVAAPVVGAVGKGLWDKANGKFDSVDRSGKLPQQDLGTLPTDESMVRGRDNQADLVGQYNKAVESGDFAGAAQLAKQMNGLKWDDVSGLAQKNIDAHNSNENWNHAGSLTGQALQSPFFGRYGGIPLAGAAMQGVVAPALAAWQAEDGKGWQAAKDTMPGVAEGSLRNVGTEAAIARTLPNLATGVADATGWGRVAQMGRNLVSAPGVAGAAPTGALGGAWNLARNVGRAGTVASGINGAVDLGRWATDQWGGGSGDFSHAKQLEVQNQVMANQNKSEGDKKTDAALAGGKILLGNIGDAQRQFGASWGRMLNEGTENYAPTETGRNTPAARSYRDAKREMYATQQSQDASDKTLQALDADPRYKGLDPNTKFYLSRIAANQANAAGQLDADRPLNERIGTHHLDQYAQGMAKLRAGQPLNDQEAAYISEISGAAPHQIPTPEQAQMAARNATLYSLMGPGNAKQMANGDLPGMFTEGPHKGAIAMATGRYNPQVEAPTPQPVQPVKSVQPTVQPPTLPQVPTLKPTVQPGPIATAAPVATVKS